MNAIEAAQNTDGGWPYYRGQTSWTEPTVFALLSELAVGSAETDTVRRGIRWLRATQNHDGGWGPQPGVGPSTWVTALAGLLPQSLIGDVPSKAGTRWLLEQTGEESSMVFRARQWMMGTRGMDEGADRGWPWFPGAAAWVMPTAISILALKKIQPISPGQAVLERIDAGQHFLVSHACKEGGWNHGSTHALGYEAMPYPETTGVALLALRGVKSPAVAAGLKVAEQFLRDPNCAGASWLRLALTAHGHHVPSEEKTSIFQKVNIVDASVRILSENSNVLLT